MQWRPNPNDATDEEEIPEAFRRAFEEMGWGGGSGDAPPARQVTFNPGCLWRLLPFLLLFLLFASGRWIIDTYTDWLWFGELGFDAVWRKQWGVQIGSFALFFAVAALFLLVNWLWAQRQADPSRSFFPRGTRWLVVGAALFTAYIFGSAGGSLWESLLRWYYAVPFNAADPVFNRDISFYLFDLPLLQALQGMGQGLLIAAMAGVAAIHALRNWALIQERPTVLLESDGLRRQLAFLLTLFLLLWAVGYWLSRYNLLYSPTGVVYGAGYTDLNARLLAFTVLAVVTVGVALTVALNVVRPNLRLPAIGIGLWFVVSLLLGAIYPAIMQRYQVEPNELSREAPYLEHNIAMTRLAYGLDKIERRSFEVETAVSGADLRANDAILQNIRLWDYRPLLQTYNQLQALRPYYSFVEVDIDRYVIDGIQRQVMLAGRELDQAGLANPTWINQELQYTHGYGIVMNPVDEISPEGLPVFMIRDLPPVSEIDIEVTRPEIYYGELTDRAVFVNSGAEEFDYPSGDQNVYTNYAGQGGVPVSSFLRRLVFAMRFGQFNVILSDYITPETRAMYYRDVRERVQRITPFLALDDDPYLVVRDDGSLVWLADGYTLSDHFPYSTPTGDGAFNYIRNAAKIAINAYDGQVTYYIAAPDDPIIQSYSNAFPGLFQPMEAMPDDLRAHIRYPEDLFEVQSRQYLTYHMQDVQVFYNKEDQWDIPQELFAEGQQQPVEPYYVISSLPTEQTPEFLLIRPYVPLGKNNMVAWLAARNDGENYGELVIYELPKQQLVFGPLQIESRIDQEPSISEQISLWSQIGSQVIRGNLIVLPLGNSFLYVEPLYLQSSASALPELKRVIVVNGNRVVMRENLTDALTALIERAPAVDVIVTDPETGSATPPPTDATTVPSDATVDELVVSANERLRAAEAAQQRGDWATYGQELEALQGELERLLELTGGTLPSEVPTETP
ncbi:MAG: UPF0182 family protein [Anaerolineales bacterium]|nr:UPF0182 family protein [Anaerolineales bacterium]MCB9128709.1 UPF0182 family protein [Ardenticatenales bacterium]MCB9172619.1 UPF0182 family protein [Ardenticatenales bacterium]